MSELRQRKPVRIPAEKKEEEEEEEDNPRFGISFLDCARVLSGLLLLSCVFSWLITDGTSLTWGYRPRISRWRTLKGLFVRRPSPSRAPAREHISYQLADDAR
jgi:hypothetical protein